MVANYPYILYYKGKELDFISESDGKDAIYEISDLVEGE